MIDEDLLVLTDEDGMALMVKQCSVYAPVVSQQQQSVLAVDQYVKLCKA